jgi:hypothetical protein
MALFKLTKGLGAYERSGSPGEALDKRLFRISEGVGRGGVPPLSPCDIRGLREGSGDDVCRSRAVVTNLKRLSEALDKAALTSQSTAEGIVAQIRADRKRIAEDIERTGGCVCRD